MNQVNTERKSKPITCVVTSDAMEKTRVAHQERLVRHGRYGKYIKRTTRVCFHDEKNESKKGDTVLLEMSRPMSARKRFNLVSIVKTAAE